MLNPNKCCLFAWEKTFTRNSRCEGLVYAHVCSPILALQEIPNTCPSRYSHRKKTRHQENQINHTVKKITSLQLPQLAVSA